MSDNQSNGVLAGFLAGAVVGAGVALLFAPASGSDTRRRIKEKAESVSGKVRDLKDGARHKLDEMGHSLSEGAREFTTAAKEGREAFQRATEEAHSRRT